MSEPKYKLGDRVWWVSSGTNYGKRIPCPMCFGKRKVTLILGDDSKIDSECGFCSHGIEHATGSAQSWEPVAEVKTGEITGVRKDSFSDRWKYEANGHSLECCSGIFSTEAEANERQKVELKEVTETAEKWFRDSFVNATKKQVWSAGYHRGRIKDAKRHIEWHEARLAMIKESRSEKGDL